MATDSVPAISIPGRWTVCVNDLEVQEIGKFAVDEYNKEQEKSLEFVRVLLMAQIQIVEGVNYKLFLEAKDDEIHKRYDALVYVKPDECMKLLEFVQVIVGGWTNAGNDGGMEDMAKFAVDEYNKKELLKVED